MKIAVIGATGMLGQPVARKLKAEGHQVVVLSRRLDHARSIFGPDYEYRRIVVDGLPTIAPALAGCEAVHLNLSARDDDEAERILWRGHENVAHAAKELGVQRISMIAGNFDVDPNHPWPVRRFFSRGVLAVKQSGVPYTVFGCTWFQESLPIFIRDGRGVILGKQPLLWHWLNIQDYARMLGHAYRMTESLNRHFVLHGPEPMTMLDALELYVSLVEPGTSIRQYPLWQVRLWAKLLNDKPLLEMAKLMAKFEVYGETGDPRDTDALLGTPMITIRDWATQLARERAHSR